MFVLTRQKNALTGYFVGPLTATAPEDITLELAHLIENVTNERDEEVEETAYYDGDGTPVQDITSIKLGYTFEGLYDEEDPAQAFVAALEFETGDGTKCMFKQVRTDGFMYYGKATITDIQTTGGEASEWAPFNCTITWDQIPTRVPIVQGP